MSIGIYNIGSLATPVPGTGPMPEIREERHCAILIENERVVEIGSNSIAKNAGETLDAEGRLALPGFTDCHTHAVFTNVRHADFQARAEGASYQQIANAGGGILETVRGVRNATQSDLTTSTQKRLERIIQCGTTYIEIKSGYGLDLESELKMLRAARDAARACRMPIATTCLAAHAIPPERDKDEYIDDICNTIIPAAITEGATAVDCFVEDGFFDKDDARRIAEIADRLEARLHLHVDQLRDGGGAKLAADLNAASASHLEHTGQEGIEALASSKTVPVLLPNSVFALGLNHYPNARAMIEAGLPVALATDYNPGTAPSPSLPFTMTLACLKMAMTPAEAFGSCTINAARALGVEHERGAIHPGFYGDVVLYDLQDYRELPFHFGVSRVHAALLARIPSTL